MNYLEAEDDGHGPRARKVTAKESMARVLESTTRATSTAKTTSTAKAVKKEKKRKDRRSKRTRQRREASDKFESPGQLQVMWQVAAQGE